MTRANSAKKRPSPDEIEDSTLHSDTLSPLQVDLYIKYCDTMNPNANSHLRKYKIPTDRPVRIYCDGIYDLFHYGHARSLEQVKIMFPRIHLIVGVCDDAMTHKYKGKTVMNEYERAESLRHCRWVDQVIEHAPWVIDQEFLDRYQIDFVAHDDIPYASQGGDAQNSAPIQDVYKFVKDQGRFIATKRTAGISTSDLITKIVRDYDDYIRRNLKRGISPKDLNLSFLKESEIKVADSVRQFGGRIQKRLREEERDVKNNWESTKEEFMTALMAWEKQSHHWIQGFVRLFEAEGPMRKMFKAEGSVRKIFSTKTSPIKNRILSAFGRGNENNSNSNNNSNNNDGNSSNNRRGQQHSE